MLKMVTTTEALYMLDPPLVPALATMGNVRQKGPSVVKTQIIEWSWKRGFVTKWFVIGSLFFKMYERKSVSEFLNIASKGCT